MKVYSLSLAVFAPASSAPSRSSSAPCRNTARRSMCATRSCTTSTWSRASRPRARISSRTSPRFRRTRSPFSAPTASPRASRRKRRRASCRCSTRPARWSPRCTIRASAMSAQGRRLILIGHAGHPEVEGTMGQISEPVTLVQTENDVDSLDIPARHAGRLRHADDAQRRRHPRHHRRAASPLHRHRRTGNPRHLLRDAEPADRGARTLEAGGRYSGGRRQEQFQLQPAARDRQRGRHALLSDRRRQRGGAGMVQRRADGRHHRRRFGARSAGRGRHRRVAPARPGRGSAS